VADERDEIRARVDLVELVGQRVALKRAGRNWKGLCPFHDDRNPSFHVSPEIGYYRCWSCGEKGDAFTWLMKTQNLTFREALEQLAKQVGVTLRARAGEASKSESEARAAAMDEALRFFREELRKNSFASEYCQGRGLSEEVRETWELGYAPDHGEALAIHLQKKKHSLSLCRTLFLVDQDPSGGFYDRFRGRLMFPIRDERGQLVAFGGRILGDGQPKYVNSGDTPILRKSRVLYGLHRAKRKLLETRSAVLVEGYLDVIACHRAGVEEAVASLGTSFADDHGRLLKRWCDRATVLYDGDEAGQKAAERACEILRTAGIQASVAVVPPGDDPDTLLEREGPAQVQKVVQSGVSPLAFTLRRLEMREDPAGAAFWNEAAAALAACDSPAEVDRHVSDLAAKYLKGQTESSARTTIYSRIREQRRYLRRGRAGVAAPIAATPVREGMHPVESLVFRAFLDLNLREPAWRAIRETGLLWTEPAARLGEALGDAFGAGPPSGSPREWIGSIEDEALRAALADAQFHTGLRIGGKLVEDAATAESLEAAVATLRKLREQRQAQELKTPSEDDEHLKKLHEHLAAKVKGRYDYTEEERERRLRS
jgi:DNA primase